MEFGQIEAFVEIARQGSITRASERLHLTQPTITSRLQSLETEVGDQLFARGPHGVVLTSVGRTLLPYAERILLAINEGKGAVAHSRDSDAGTVFIGSTTNVSIYVMPMLLRQFAASHPNVHVVNRTGHSNEIVSKVLSREVQIGFVYQVHNSQIIAVNVYEDELLLVVYPEHPFCKRQSVTMQELLHERFVFLGGDDYNRTLKDLFTSAGVGRPTPMFEVDRVEVAKTIVQAGLGIALLHRISVSRDLAQGTLNSVPLEGIPRISRPVHAIFSSEIDLDGLPKEFLEIAKTMPRLL